MRVRGNIFDDSSAPAQGERFEVLWRHGAGLTLERIVSSARPEPVEYDQAHDEWVLLLRGEATLEIEGEVLTLGHGDYVLLPAHTRHRVLDVSAGALWLALHAQAG